VLQLIVIRCRLKIQKKDEIHDKSLAKPLLFLVNTMVPEALNAADLYRVHYELPRYMSAIDSQINSLLPSAHTSCFVGTHC